ncbi:MAG: hypothetical protein AB1384_05525 [Actinomycetota bacterium]
MLLRDVNPALSVKVLGGTACPPPGYSRSPIPLAECLQAPYPPPYIFRSRAAAAALYLVPPQRLEVHLPPDYKPLKILGRSVVGVIAMHFHYVGRADGFKPVVDKPFNEICYFSPVNVNGLVGMHAYRMELNHPEATRLGIEQAGWPKLLQNPTTEIGVGYLKVENQSDHPLRIEFEAMSAMRGSPRALLGRLLIKPALFNAAPFLFPWPREGVLTMPDQRFKVIRPLPARAKVGRIDYLTDLGIMMPEEISRPALSFLFRKIEFVIDDSIFFVKS